MLKKKKKKRPGTQKDKTDKQEKPNKKKLSGFDFQAWDKLDVVSSSTVTVLNLIKIRAIKLYSIGSSFVLGLTSLSTYFQVYQDVPGCN